MANNVEHGELLAELKPVIDSTGVSQIYRLFVSSEGVQRRVEIVCRVGKPTEAGFVPDKSSEDHWTQIIGKNFLLNCADPEVPFTGAFYKPFYIKEGELIYAWALLVYYEPGNHEAVMEHLISCFQGISAAGGPAREIPLPGANRNRNALTSGGKGAAPLSMNHAMRGRE